MTKEKKAGSCFLRYWLVAPAFLAGLLAGFFLNSGRTGGNVEERQGGYRFISPLLDCEGGEAASVFPSFKAGLSSLVEKYKKSGTITGAAVYFRDLNNGPWYGVNEKEKFRPASLLKVPIAMAIYKAAEDDPGILKKRLKYTKAVPLLRTQSIVPPRKIMLGKEYTVEELIGAMIRYSDNQALHLLASVVQDSYLTDLYKTLGVENSVLENIDGTLSVRSFATFYRILFNATYLDREHSERLLELLSESDYKNALVAGVPPGTVVAHKFGETSLPDRGRQLQDCGIVYSPKRPYLLCVMAEGRRLKDLEGFIGDVSRRVYERVDGEY